MRRLLLASLVLLRAGHALGAAPAISRAELTAFFRSSDIANVTLSPDGAHLTYVGIDAGRAALKVADVASPRLAKTTIKTIPTAFVNWVSASTLVYARDNTVQIVDADGSNPRTLGDDETFVYYDMGRKVTRRLTPVRIIAGEPARVLVSTVSATGVRDKGKEYYVLSADGAPPERVGSLPVGESLTDQQGHPRLFEPSVFQLVPVPNEPPAWVMYPQTVEYIDETGIRHNLDSFLGDASRFRFKFTADRYFDERTLPLGFGADSNLLYVASNVGRDRYGIYALDLNARKQAPFAIEDDVHDLAAPSDDLNSSRLVLDRQGVLVGIRQLSPTEPVHWLDAGLESTDARLRAEFPGRSVEILSWSEDRSVFLFVAVGPAEPGRYYIYHAATDEAAEYLRRAPSFPGTWSGQTEEIAFATADGRRLGGRLTLPRRPAFNPPPLVVYCRDFPIAPRASLYDPEAQALSALGFAVLEVDHRGTTGFGMEHRDAIKAGVDTVPLEDIRAAIDWTTAHYSVSRTLMAMVGEGLGGFLALRSLELFPEEFRCAVAINAPADLGAWSNNADIVPDMAVMAQRKYFAAMAGVGGFAGLSGVGGLSAVRAADRIVKPVMLLESPDPQGLAHRQTDSLRSALKRAGADVEYSTVPTGYDRQTPESRASVLDSVARFLRTSFYNYEVKVGQPRVVK